VSTGDVLTATAQNNLLTTLNSHTVPPAAMLQLTADTTVTNNQDISWNTTVVYDTDGLFAAGSPTRLTCQTTGIYLVTFGIGLSAATALAGPYAYIGKTGSLNYASAIFGIDGATARMQISTVMSMTASTDYITAGIGWSSATGAVTAFGTTADARRGRLTATFLGKTA
jgi:hypothetical protein